MDKDDDVCPKCSETNDDEVHFDISTYITPHGFLKTPDNTDRILLQCDSCLRWYHTSCVNIDEYEIDDLDVYHCELCAPKAGPTKRKVIKNYHRNDYYDENAVGKPIENGSHDFVKWLKSRTDFPPPVRLLKEIDNGHGLDIKLLESTSFDTPILVKSTVGLDMIMPENMSLDEIEHSLNDPSFMVDVIDSYKQKDYKMKFSTFLNLFRDKNRSRLYNLISMEFSKTRLSPRVKLPGLAEKISWVHQYWPKAPERIHDAEGRVLNVASLTDHYGLKPEVAKFCLISMRDSYTDFHVDFGGSSVWYHILWGEKLFYLIEPTDGNLALYDDWMKSKNRSERFFGDEVEKCCVCTLTAGQTFFIPTGWIHAVLTSQDSLVFGGNFLHSFNIPLQLRIYDMELECPAYEKYMFPNYELLNWHAAYHFLDQLKELNEEKIVLQRYLQTGIQALVEHMKIWLERNKSKKLEDRKYVEKIDSLSFTQLQSKLERALKINEKIQQEQRLKRSLKLASHVKKQPGHSLVDSGPQINTTPSFKFVFKLQDDDFRRFEIEKVSHGSPKPDESFPIQNEPKEMKPKETEPISNPENAPIEHEPLKVTLKLKPGQLKKSIESKKRKNFEKTLQKTESETSGPVLDIGSAFGVSKRGRVQKINHDLLASIDLEESDDQSADFGTKNELSNSEDSADSDINRLLIDEDDEKKSTTHNNQECKVAKPKKKKLATAKQRLAMKMKMLS